MIGVTINGVAYQVYKNAPANLSQFIVDALAFGDRTFLVYRDRRLTYSQALERAAGLANLLRAEFGIGPGVRAAIAMRNSPEWIISFLAILLTGATASLVNSRGSGDEIVYALHDTECALVIADDKRAAAIGDGFQGRMITADDAGNFRTADGRILEIIPAPVVASSAGPEDPAIIMFTSGTTGRPKGAVLTHRGVSAFVLGMRHNGTANLIRNARKLGVDVATLARSLPQMATLAIFPLFHVSGASAMLMSALTNGGKIVVMERWDPAAALDLIARERITMFQGPPSIFWDALACPEFATADVSSITNLGIGGQATPPNLLDALLKVFPKAAAGGGWGMTETNGSISSATGDEYMANRNASGRVMPGCEVRVVDEHGNELPLGSVGEIWARSCQVMAGYWNKPEANQAVFAGDGWIKTGDVGFVDADRYITIVDRKKDVIISGGENIYCAELERVFQEFPGVLETAAFGVPDDRLGERAILAVVPQPDAKLDADAMRAFGRRHLADYKIPAEILFTSTPFVRNAVGKIDKAVLRKSYGT
jgi:acyl-CoA synthetase (AMP-forming)/AMP-acid ligase II